MQTDFMEGKSLRVVIGGEVLDHLLCLPGRGKTHLVSVQWEHELLVQRGYEVLFVPAYRLVQRLLAAKRDLALEAALRRLDRYDAVILDDLGYVQQLPPYATQLLPNAAYAGHKSGRGWPGIVPALRLWR